MAKKKATPKVAEPVVAEPKAEVAKEATTVKKAGWIKVSADELQKIQAEGKLVGYNPATGEALVK